MRLSSISLAITRLGGSQLSLQQLLWPTGTEAGLWIDPSTTAASFQDSAGTTALSAIGTVLDSSNPVGLMLDRKGGLVLGPELVTNGAFAGVSNGTDVTTLTGWGAYGAPTSRDIQSEQLRLVTSAGGQGAVLTVTTVVGKRYKLTVSASGLLGPNAVYSTYFANASSATGAVSVSWIADTVSSLLYFRTGTDTAGTSYYDNISVREIPGIHLSQSTSAARPVASARKNLLVGTATLSTQNVTVAAIPHTISFTGGGTLAATGTYTGALTNGQTFTPNAGTLTLTPTGSITTAQLERGSVATTYQPVVSASSYDASVAPVATKFDGVDDNLASATFTANTVLTDGMDCLIAVRRDSAASVVAGLYNAVADATQWFGMAESGSGSGCVGSGAGTPTVWVDGVQLAGGTAVTRDTLHTALTAGAFHILEFRGLDLSTWTDAKYGLYTSYALNGAIGGKGIMLFPSTTDAIRDRARTELAASVGLVL